MLKERAYSYLSAECAGTGGLDELQADVLAASVQLDAEHERHLEEDALQRADACTRIQSHSMPVITLICLSNALIGHKEIKLKGKETCMTIISVNQ